MILDSMRPNTLQVRITNVGFVYATTASFESISKNGKHTILKGYKKTLETQYNNALNIVLQASKYMKRHNLKKGIIYFPLVDPSFGAELRLATNEVDVDIIVMSEAPRWGMEV